MSTGQVLFQFVRYWARRGVSDPDRGRDVLVTEAVHALSIRADHAGSGRAGHASSDRAGSAASDSAGDAGSDRADDTLTGRYEVTVNEVAAELGIDQSGASRMIAQATVGGYLSAQPSPQDKRRRTISVTPAGVTLLASAHQWQDDIFDTLTEAWTPTERTEFERAMQRLLASSRALPNQS
jgi:DNA-binding MarR family transcriptional regulator